MRAVRERAAAQAAIPNLLRQARDGAPAFEDRAVRAVMQYGGFGPLDVIRAEAGRRRDDGLLDFDSFHAAFRFPLRLHAGRLKFHFDGLATDLLNAPERTPLWSAYADLLESRPGATFGLVFRWPRVKKCRGWCVLHPAGSADLLGGFRLLLRIAGDAYEIEPLPAFLAARGFAPEKPDAELAEDEESDGGDD